MDIVTMEQLRQQNMAVNCRMNIIKTHMRSMVKTAQIAQYQQCENELDSLALNRELWLRQFEDANSKNNFMIGQCIHNQRQSSSFTGPETIETLGNMYTPHTSAYINQNTFSKPTVGSEYPHLLATGLVEGKEYAEDKFSYKIIGEETYSDIDYNVSKIMAIKDIRSEKTSLLSDGITDAEEVMSGLYVVKHTDIVKLTADEISELKNGISDLVALYIKIREDEKESNYCECLLAIASFITNNHYINSYLTKRFNELIKLETSYVIYMDSFANDCHEFINSILQNEQVPSKKGELYRVVDTLCEESILILKNIVFEKHVGGDEVTSEKYYDVTTKYFTNTLYLTSFVLKNELLQLGIGEIRYVTSESHKWLHQQLEMYFDDLRRDESYTLCLEYVPHIVCVIDSNLKEVAFTLNRYRNKYILTRVI